MFQLPDVEFQVHHPTSTVLRYTKFFVRSDLRLDLLQILLQPLLPWICLRPFNAQALALIRFGNEVEMYMIYHLMCHSTVVLQDIVLFCAGCAGDFGCDGEEFAERVVGDVG